MTAADENRPAVQHTELKPCPCGATPTNLCLTGEHERPKWARVSGDCCGAWEIEFRNDYKPLGGEESRRLATEAWNLAPRATPGSHVSAP